jgi:hypothetical protein
MLLLVFSHHCSIELMCFVLDATSARSSRGGQRRRVLTVWAAELGDGLYEALVQVGRPPQPRLGVPRQHHPSHRRRRGAVPRSLHPFEHAAPDPYWTSSLAAGGSTGDHEAAQLAVFRRARDGDASCATSYAAAASRGRQAGRGPVYAVAELNPWAHGVNLVRAGGARGGVGIRRCPGRIADGNVRAAG